MNRQLKFIEIFTDGACSGNPGIGGWGVVILINDKNPNRRSFMERAAINAPIQGGAADIIKRVMIRLPGELKNANLSAKMLLQVHDELVFDVPQKELEKTTKLVKTVMENVSELSVPLVVDTGHGENWNEAH